MNLPGESQAPLRLVARRRVVHISGFEPVGLPVLDRRLKSGLRKFGALWGAETHGSEPVVSDDGRAVTWQVESRGPNWATDVHYTVLRWDELMEPYTGRSWSGRMLHGYKALFELAFNGTLAAYFRANVRYGLFFLYPLLLLFGFLLLGVAAGIVAAMLGIPWAAVTAPLVGIVVFVLLLRFLGAYFYLDFALADWAFAADLSRDAIPGLEPVLERFTDEVFAALRDPDADDVLLSSVSLGAVMLAEAIDRIYASEPEADVYFRRAALLTVGSSILKIGLHPAAERFRRLVGRIGAEKDLFWAEYQAKVDPINFYKTDPVADLGNAATGRPLVRQIRIRDMMTDADYRRAQRSSLHLHRQFVMPNGKRYFYDFYQISFGPIALKARVRIGERITTIFGRDGRFRPELLKRRNANMAVAE
jgi:hypothetical protein